MIRTGVTTKPINVDDEASVEMFPDHIVPPGTKVTARFDPFKVVGRATAVRGENWTTFPITRQEFCVH